jgi:Flp pilus assembly protein TadD
MHCRTSQPRRRGAVPDLAALIRAPACGHHHQQERHDFMSWRTKNLALAAALAVALSGSMARAETVEVAPGVQVTKKSFRGAPNQQPFFGFVSKTAEQRAEDEQFVNALVKATGSKEKAFAEVSLRGWRAITKGNAPEAVMRFNQAWLLAPEQSAVYHGLAIVTMMRFGDIDFADELFKIARRQPNPLKPLAADHGRALLLAKRPQDAQAVLEQAVLETPGFADAWSNLGFARLQNGDKPAACAAAEQAAQRKPSNDVLADLNLLRASASCKPAE